MGSNCHKALFWLQVKTNSEFRDFVAQHMNKPVVKYCIHTLYEYI